MAIAPHPLSGLERIVDGWNRVHANPAVAAVVDTALCYLIPKAVGYAAHLAANHPIETLAYTIAPVAGATCAFLYSERITNQASRVLLQLGIGAFFGADLAGVLDNYRGSGQIYLSLRRGIDAVDKNVYHYLNNFFKHSLDITLPSGREATGAFIGAFATQILHSANEYLSRSTTPTNQPDITIQ